MSHFTSSRPVAIYECTADIKTTTEKNTKCGLFISEKEFKQGDAVTFEDLRYWFGYVDTNYFQYKAHGAVPA